jgi:hypothetical protein
MALHGEKIVSNKMILHLSIYIQVYLQWNDKKMTIINGLRQQHINFLNHNRSHIPFVIPQNSASALERATTFCFLLLHVIKFPPMKVKYPDVDRRSLILPAQSASV